MHKGTLSALAALTFAAAPLGAVANTSNFEISGKIYNKYMFQNDATQGCVSLGNPFWSDNTAGHNGLCSEFELNIQGRVSDRITAGIQLKSRWGMLWQDWYENGDIRWDYPSNTPFTENTSGESLGQNHAAYMQLRSAWIRIAPPIPTVKWVHVGSSDLGMWNEWTIGKSRFIDKTNGKGIFVEGSVAKVSYQFGAMAMPKLFVGPGWNTGLRNSDPLAGFWGADWAYAGKLGYNPISDLSLTGIAAYLNDVEADKFDPDLTGAPSMQRGADHAIAWNPRFQGVNTSLEANYTPSWLDVLSVRGLLAWSWNSPNTKYATNAVRNSQGFSPLVFKMDETGKVIPASDFAGRLTVETYDPFGIGLSLKGEYFNIGTDFNADWGARRESDVLLTEGVITDGFIGGGQLPTLNIANEFVDFDNGWYENIIGWHGATLQGEYVRGPLRLTGEYTFIGYNTNMQNRDTDNQYPDFLYTDGFTDVYQFTANSDYANTTDRGRDPRSVYKQYQDRRTQIAILNAELLVPQVKNLTARTKLKYVHDVDFRKKENLNDTYVGDDYTAFVQAEYQFTNELKGALGYQFSWWNEKNANGSQEQGFYDYQSRRNVTRAGLSYVFGGATLFYTLEYFQKDQFRHKPGLFNQAWNVWRSKASLEVAW